MSAVSHETGSDAFDQARADAFGERFAGALNEAAMTVMASIGHRTGLFDAMEGAPALTSAGVAVRAGLNERYVREWLAAMTAAGVVDFDAAAGTYRLPAEHACWLTRASVPNNLAVAAQTIPLMGSVEAALIDCFRHGGGLPYDQYHGFHQVMAEDSAQTVVHALFDAILPLVPGIAGRLEQGIAVLDVGCGSGRALLKLAEHFPCSRFTGYDLCVEPIERARTEAVRLGLSNLTFEARDLAEIPPEGPFDLITAFDAVHDQRDPAGLLRSIAGALAPDGVFLMQDVAGSSHLQNNLAHPLGTYLYAISTAHCMSVSLGQGGPGLGTMWGEELAHRMLGEAGFASVDQKSLPHDPVNTYYVARRGNPLT